MLSSSVTALESVVSGDLEDTDDQETHRPSYNSQWKKQEQDQRRREDWEVAGSTTPSRCVKGMKTMKVERDMIIIKIIGAERMMQRRMMMLGDRWQETSKAATQDMRRYWHGMTTMQLCVYSFMTIFRPFNPELSCNIFSF
ncbi:hypothetical protein LWI28_007465 [Acer negundo]|uniref:Uncharacterized protein n=1 Tax=Acer negundo TaxID=4023 RepID=A0AAD5P3Y8_ACENE|nr:hypothetical protein LWI28_007465 [Acer negundo]